MASKITEILNQNVLTSINGQLHFDDSGV